MNRDEIDQRVEYMRNLVPRIQDKLSHRGITVTQDRIYANFRRCESWYYGRLALGYLLRATGWEFDHPSSAHAKQHQRGEIIDAPHDKRNSG